MNFSMSNMLGEVNRTFWFKRREIPSKPPSMLEKYDMKKYATLGVMLTPAVIVDGKVVLSGKVPTAAEPKKIFSDFKK